MGDNNEEQRRKDYRIPTNKGVLLGYIKKKKNLRFSARERHNQNFNVSAENDIRGVDNQQEIHCNSLEGSLHRVAKMRGHYKVERGICRN